MKKWKSSPPELIATFQKLLPKGPVTQRKMFGFPAAFANGNLFMGLFEDRMMLRLPEGERVKFLALEGARVFEPMPGRPMREYVLVPPALMSRPAGLRAWIAKARDYAAGLPNKAGAARKPARGARQKA